MCTRIQQINLIKNCYWEGTSNNYMYSTQNSKNYCCYVHKMLYLRMGLDRLSNKTMIPIHKFHPNIFQPTVSVLLEQSRSSLAL